MVIFDPREIGMLNQALAWFGVGRHAWLQDPAWAMTCCILPGVWAGMGTASLIYIAALQGMGSIFLLTFGGPGDATNVLSLVIWKEAYNNLRFSTATTMAWFLGTALIAFTYLQIRFLRRVEFRQAAAN